MSNFKSEKIKTFPQNVEAEHSLLGLILMDNAYLEDVIEIMHPRYFSIPINGEIYETIIKIVDNKQVANPITLKPYFENNPDLKALGGASYLIDLVSSVMSTFGIKDYAVILYELYLRRQLILLAEKMSVNAQHFSITENIITQIENIEKELYELAMRNSKTDLQPFEEIAKITLNSIDIARKNPNKLTGLSSGLADLDLSLGGLAKSDLIILAGRPSMGKTALAANIAMNIAKMQLNNKSGGGSVAFFSLEMSAEQIVSRLLSQEAQVPSHKMRRGDIQESDWVKLSETNKLLSKLNLYIDATPALTVTAIRNRVRRMKRQNGLDIIIIDYLQLIQGSSERRNDNRVQEISDITRSLKGIAKEFNIPVIALSQLSRAVELRDDKRPQLSDLRESGSIEQDADIVMFVFREAYYLRRMEPDEGTDEHVKWKLKMMKADHLAEIIIAKQRHGAIGNVRLYFDEQYTSFGNLVNDKQYV